MYMLNVLYLNIYSKANLNAATVKLSKFDGLLFLFIQN